MHVTTVIANYCKVPGVFYKCIVEARPGVQGIFLLRFLAGASFSGPLFYEEAHFSVLTGAVLWICATMSIYILNGVMDVEEDQINGSSRPIASGKLGVVQATGVAGCLAILSVLGCFALGSAMGWSVVALLALGWLYSGPPFYLKRWPSGWAVLGISAALTTYNAGYISNGSGTVTLRYLIFAIVMALWLGIVSQTKDLSDIEGDKLAGRRSGPVVWGEGVARLVFSGAALSLAGVCTLSAVLFTPGLLVPSLVLMTGAVALALVTLGPWSRGDKARRRRSYRTFMLTQYGANLTVVVW